MRHAASVVADGGVVVFPTETVYGIGGLTCSSEAIDSIYRIKGRPSRNPLIAHVLDATMARMVVDSWDRLCDELAERFWPGPLTLVLPRRSSVPSRSTAGLDTIAVRSPGHPVARELLELVGEPISAPSANRSGSITATGVEAVMQEFSDYDDLCILDGGASVIGIESTVLDLCSDPPRILRPGSIGPSQLQEVIPSILTERIESQDASPGTSLAHYQPRTPVLLLERTQVMEQLRRSGQSHVVLSHGPMELDADAALLEMPVDDAAYAARLYSALREADQLDHDRIIIERPTGQGEFWNAILDRLQRASAMADD